MTKPQILDALSKMPVSKLAKLYKYTQLLLIPEDDLLLNVNMTAMRDKAYALADQYFPEWTDRTSSDFGNLLVELIALFSEKDFWYVNAFAAESIFSKTTVYSDLFSKSVTMGYSPVLCRGSRLSVSVFFEAGDETEYLPGSLIFQVPNTNAYYTNPFKVTVPFSVSPYLALLEMVEGTYMESAETFNGHRLLVLQEKVDVTTTTLNQGAITWERVNLFGLSGDQEHFVVLPEENGMASIFFGTDGFGKTPDFGTSFVVGFVKTSGADALTVTNAMDLLFSTSQVRGITGSAFIKWVAGNDPESMASIKNNAPLYFTSEKGVINRDTALEFLLAQPEIKRAYVNPVGNQLFFWALGADGLTLSNDMKAEISGRILPRLILGYDTTPMDTLFATPIPSFTLNVYVLKGTDKLDAEASIKQLLIDWTDPLVLSNYGKGFNLFDVQQFIISAIEGVQNVVFAGVTTIVVPSNDLIQKLELSDITTVFYEL